MKGLVGAVVLAALMVGACANDGRELQAPKNTATTAAPSSTTTTAGAVVSPGGGSGQPALISAAFADGQPIPVSHSCEGADVSPPLAWTGIPAGTIELAITVTDPDAGGFVHWVIAHLAPTLSSIGGAEVPAGAVQASNGFNNASYNGPCPPSGNHHYVFTLYALAAPSGITAGEKGTDAVARLEGTATTAKLTLTGTYARQ